MTSLIEKYQEEKMNLDKNKIVKFNILAIICIIIFSFVVSPVTLQNDTYYTIKIGEHIWRKIIRK